MENGGERMRFKPPFHHMKKVRSIDEEISHRILVLSSFIVVAFLVIFIRLFYIQVISHDSYVAKKDDYFGF